jgi:1,4-alpha-glucan branching enzyme
VPDDDGAVPVLASITNFSGSPHHQYRLGLPHPGRWNEILNTDVEAYGGSGVGNLGSVMAEEVPWHGQPYSALVTVPPLAAVWLEPAEPVVPDRSRAAAQVVPGTVSEEQANEAASAYGTSGRTGSGSVSGRRRTASGAADGASASGASASAGSSGGSSVSEGTGATAAGGGTSYSEGPVGDAAGAVLPAAGSEADASAPQAPSTRTTSGRTSEKE